jgi:putative permease
VIDVLKHWFGRYFSDPEAVLLVAMLMGGLLLIALMGGILAPVLGAIVIAYLLQWLINLLISWRVPRLASVIIVYITFMGLFFYAMLVLWPIIWAQLLKLVDELPNMILLTKKYMYLLPEKFPEFVSIETIDAAVASTSVEIKRSASRIVTTSIANIPSIIALIVYLILVPIMVFFFLKDHKQIISYVTNFLPDKRKVLRAVWVELDEQIGNYVRGKVAEVLIVGIVSYSTFAFLGLQYAILLAVVVGFSVLVPYVGAAVVTVPVLLVAFFQWGFESQFVYVVIAYGVIQALDGNVLVPLLFSEAVNVHPVAIIIAVLVFGGIWGFWGIFFAIPLATLVKALIVAWPKRERMAGSPS